MRNKTLDKSTAVCSNPSMRLFSTKEATLKAGMAGNRNKFRYTANGMGLTPRTKNDEGRIGYFWTLSQIEKVRQMAATVDKSYRKLGGFKPKEKAS